jgi:LmbE family N-acetylglucosaminyl deacetylase
MQQFKFQSVRRLLCLGAHSDDIEIGCGATLLKVIRDNPNLEITWVVFSAGGVRTSEARASARAYLREARHSEIIIRDFRTSYFPVEYESIKVFFETLKAFEPDLVFTHYRDDRHQDHRVLSDLAWNTFRSHVILEYEVPKFDGDLGIPNVFVPVTRAHCVRKARLLQKHFRSQATKHWFADDLFLALPRIRGMECNSPTKYAEAFYGRKLLMW